MMLSVSLRPPRQCLFDVRWLLRHRPDSRLGQSTRRRGRPRQIRPEGADGGKMEDPMSSTKTTTPRGRGARPRGRGPATRQRTGSFPSLSRSSKGSARWPSSRPPASAPEKRYNRSALTLDLEPGDYTPDKVRATREVFGSVATAVRQVPRVEVSSLRHWEQGIRSPSAVVPPVPGRNERHPRPLVGKDRDGSSEKRKERTGPTSSKDRTKVEQALHPRLERCSSTLTIVVPISSGAAPSNRPWRRAWRSLSVYLRTVK